MKAYELLKPIADSKLKHYKTDFTKHDKKALKDNPEAKFVWFVRESGTHMVILDDGPLDNKAKDILESLDKANHEKYLFDGKKLIKLASLDRIIKDYTVRHFYM